MTQDKDLFLDIKNSLLRLDPVAFIEKHLMLDGKPFRLNGNGYKPFVDIYRYAGIKALERGAKPMILVKSRQVGGTTMASALEMYFMGSGLFGTDNNPPIRVIHAFPQLEHAAAYSKTKLNPMIVDSISTDAQEKKGKHKSFMQSLLDTTSETNNSLHFKQFTGGNHIWIESTGLNADRLRGRQLSLETELPTPTGFIKLKDLKEGDQLFDESGNICNVTKMHPINLSPESYKITFDDGTIVEACADHLWLTYTKRDRKIYRKFLEGKSSKKPEPKIKNTKEIFKTLKVSTSDENNHSIPNCLPLNYDKKELPIDPYLFGLWLGDGDKYRRIESADPEILQNYEHRVVPSSINHMGSFSSAPSKSCSYRVIGLTTALTKLGVIKNTHSGKGDFYYKHIPEIYMRASAEQRLALLQGLLDTDGSCSKDGRIEFSQVRKDLAYQVYELILSLGIKAHICKKERWRYGIQYKDAYCINFVTKLPVFRMKRKIKNIKNNNKFITKITHRFIKSIEPIDSIPMRCITVDSPSHLFLITRSFIPTHNTADVIFFDECFPYSQNIQTENGKVTIGKLYDMYSNNETLPKVLTFNEEKEIFEYKEITNAWKRDKRKLFEFQCNNEIIKCTGNHRFLTQEGWKKLENISNGDLIRSNNKFLPIFNISETTEEEIVYDIEVDHNHNFVIGEHGLVAHNCQDISGAAISNATKMLNASKYGRVGDGVQVYFGTPKRKGSDYYKMWIASSQQYFYLGCEKCKQHFPLYTPESDEWEKIWLYGFIVKCAHCGHEQDKRPAAERGKWVASRKPDEYSIVGFHINQLYMPDFTKEKILSEKPGTHPIATERSYRNEVLGEFYQGDSSPITPEEIRDLCGDVERKMRASIAVEEDLLVTLGIDYGLKSDLEQLADNTKSTQGQSFSTAVILVTKGPQLLSIEFCTKFKRNDEESKRALIDQLMRQYSVKLAIGDIGFSQEFSEKLHTAYGDRYLVSRAHNTVNGHIKYNKEIFPKEIIFQKNFYYAELIEQLRGGKIRFPLGDYEKIAWLTQHCSNNEIKPSISRGGDPTIHYVKSGPNDGFAALLNAYIAYKFVITNGLTSNNPFANQNNTGAQKPLVVGGHVSRRF